jgi:hypothetical protein
MCQSIYIILSLPISWICFVTHVGARVFLEFRLGWTSPVTNRWLSDKKIVAIHENDWICAFWTVLWWTWLILHVVSSICVEFLLVYHHIQLGYLSYFYPFYPDLSTLSTLSISISKGGASYPITQNKITYQSMKVDMFGYNHDNILIKTCSFWWYMTCYEISHSWLEISKILFFLGGSAPPWEKVTSAF